MSMHNGNGSASELEFEAEARRDNLANTLDELRGRMTPGQVMDEVLSYAKGSGASFLQSLFEAAKANPIPTMLIGAGCAMFLSQKNSPPSRGSYERGQTRSRDGGMSETAQGEGAYQRVSNSARAAAGGLADTASATADGARRAAKSVQDRMSNAADAVSSGARTSAAGLRETAGDLRDGVRNTMTDMSRRASETYESYAQGIGETSANAADYAREQAQWARSQARRGWSALQEQPLILAALGVAIGAAVAAALPSTRTENELLGETSDRVKDAAAGLAGEQYEKAKTAAASVVSEVSEAAEAAGLTTEKLRDAASDVTERLKSVGGAAMQATTRPSKKEESAREDGPSFGDSSDRASR
jgi:hypothetical protein